MMRLALIIGLAASLGVPQLGWGQPRGYGDRVMLAPVTRFSSACWNGRTLEGLSLIIIRDWPIHIRNLRPPHGAVAITIFVQRADVPQPIRATGQFVGDQLSLIWRDELGLNTFEGSIDALGVIRGTLTQFGPGDVDLVNTLVLRRRNPEDSAVPNCR